MYPLILSLSSAERTPFSFLWSSSTVKSILTIKKYKGDALLKAANAIFAEKDGVREDYDSIKDTLFGTSELEEERLRLQEEMNVAADDFVLYVGNKKLVKRKEFEQYISKSLEI